MVEGCYSTLEAILSKFVSKKTEGLESVPASPYAGYHSSVLSLDLTDKWKLLETTVRQGVLPQSMSS